jgi:hypothetical protein
MAFFMSPPGKWLSGSGRVVPALSAFTARAV